MKDKSSLHMKIQELCDCYAGTDPLKEMSVLEKSEDRKEAALKWLSLAALHGVNFNAEKIELSLNDDGKIHVTAKYREAELPSPESEVGKEIFASMGEITHLEGGEGKTLLAMGIRDSSIELKVKMKSKNSGRKLSIEFP